MTQAEINALKRLAATPGAGAHYSEIPNGDGHMPIGKTGVLRERLADLRSRGLATEGGQGRWWITDAGRAALDLSAAQGATPSRVRRPPAAKPAALPPRQIMRVPVWPRGK